MGPFDKGKQKKDASVADLKWIYEQTRWSEGSETDLICHFRASFLLPPSSTCAPVFKESVPPTFCLYVVGLAGRDYCARFLAFCAALAIRLFARAYARKLISPRHELGAPDPTLYSRDMIQHGTEAWRPYSASHCYCSFTTACAVGLVLVWASAPSLCWSLGSSTRGLSLQTEPARAFFPSLASPRVLFIAVTLDCCSYRRCCRS
ncbi:hypothetical protein C8R44DRAFT_210523 [Mycena epipterygia]|nr:hypothetical protein C8R44DRAFT_210523 [Mycena epipterygia]